MIILDRKRLIVTRPLESKTRRISLSQGKSALVDAEEKQTITHKVCLSCQKIKLVQEFYRRQKDKDCFNSYCKECNKRNVRQWRQDNPKRYGVLQRRSHTTEKNTNYQIRHRSRHPKRVFARAKIRYARANGLVLDHCAWPNCPEKRSIQGHHPSYDRPYEIAPLCRLHHKAADLLRDKLGLNLPIIDISVYYRSVRLL